jgi:hypothetical protein
MSRKPHSGRWAVELLPFAGSLRDMVCPAVQSSFDDEEQARQECARLERALRRCVNPFQISRGGLASLTSLGTALFRDWLLDAGIEPPEPAQPTDWASWYDRCQSTWDGLMRERFWEALDRLHFHRVVERPARVGYVVLEVGWLWHDEPPYSTGPECRRPVEVFSTRAAAEKRRRELERQRRGEWPADMELVWEGGQGGPEHAPLFEVVEVDWEGQP